MSEPEPAGLRIGDAERTAAMSALDAHLQAGRLDATEYGERSATASVARTVDELRPLFDDLPEPHPPQLSPRSTTPAVGAPAPVTTPSDDRGGGGLQRWAPVVSGALPLLAVILFFTVPIANAWVFFLLIPLGGALLAGSRHPDRE